MTSVLLVPESSSTPFPPIPATSLLVMRTSERLNLPAAGSTGVPDLLAAR